MYKSSLLLMDLFIFKSFLCVFRLHKSCRSVTDLFHPVRQIRSNVLSPHPNAHLLLTASGPGARPPASPVEVARVAFPAPLPPLVAVPLGRTAGGLTYANPTR